MAYQNRILISPTPTSPGKNKKIKKPYEKVLSRVLFHASSKVNIWVCFAPAKTSNIETRPSVLECILHVTTEPG